MVLFSFMGFIIVYIYGIRAPPKNPIYRYFLLFLFYIRLRKTSAAANMVWKNPNLIQHSHFTDLESDSKKKVPQISQK